MTKSKPTIRDVAKLANVSSTTVSYILSGRRGEKSRISSETRERVLKATSELGYIPNAAARNLRRQRTERICLVIPALGQPYLEMLAHDLQEQANEQGYSMVVAITGSVERELQTFNNLRQGLADGVVFIGPRFLDASYFSELAKGGMAVVVLSNQIQIGDDFDLVVTNETQARQDAVNYLLGKGHVRIAFLADTTNINHAERMKDYLRILQESGVTVDPRLVCGEVSNRSTAYRRTQELLAEENPPTAILTVADITAIGAIMAARDSGVRVPEELAIIGAGNVPESEITLPPLTTIGQKTIDFNGIATLLFSRLNEESAPPGRRLEFPRELILRGSA